MHTSSGFLQLKTFYVPYFWNYSVILRPIMLMKRIIPSLDIKDGRTVKGVNFEGLVDAGDPVELARRYVQEGADEIVFLDITATTEKRETLTDLVRQISAEITIDRKSVV